MDEHDFSSSDDDMGPDYMFAPNHPDDRQRVLRPLRARQSWWPWPGLDTDQDSDSNCQSDDDSPDQPHEVLDGSGDFLRRWVPCPDDIAPWLLAQRGQIYIEDCILSAAQQGQQKVLQWLWNQFPTTFAAESNCVRAMDHAAASGDLHAIQALRSMDPPCAWRAGTWAAAAKHGHLHLLQWAHVQLDLPVHGPPSLSSYYRHSDPAGMGNIQCEHLWDESICQGAAEGGHLHILKWLRSLDPPCPLDAETSKAAAAAGNLEIFNWLTTEEEHTSWHTESCTAAAAGGHLGALKWMRQQVPPCPWTEATCAAAAAGGHLEVLQWLRDPEQQSNQPCPWDAEAASAAAAGGHMHILQWIRVQAPALIGVSTATAAFKEKCSGVLDWLLSQKLLSKQAMHQLCNEPRMPVRLHEYLDTVQQYSRYWVQALQRHRLMKHLSADYLLAIARFGDAEMVIEALGQFEAKGLLISGVRAAFAGDTVSNPERDWWPYIRYWSDQDVSMQHAEVAGAIVKAIKVLGAAEKARLRQYARRCGTFIPVQLAHLGVDPKLDWDQEIYRWAAAQGSPSLLKWLLAQPASKAGCKLDVCDSNGRVLLLVHAHGWQYKHTYPFCTLAEIERRHLAFYGAAWHHRRNPSAARRATLGQLPDAILKNIATEADIDFSWSYALAHEKAKKTLPWHRKDIDWEQQW